MLPTKLDCLTIFSYKMAVLFAFMMGWTSSQPVSTHPAAIECHMTLFAQTSNAENHDYHCRYSLRAGVFAENRRCAISYYWQMPGMGLFSVSYLSMSSFHRAVKALISDNRRHANGQGRILPKPSQSETQKSTEKPDAQVLDLKNQTRERIFPSLVFEEKRFFWVHRIYQQQRGLMKS